MFAVDRRLGSEVRRGRNEVLVGKSELDLQA